MSFSETSGNTILKRVKPSSGTAATATGSAGLGASTTGAVTTGAATGAGVACAGLTTAAPASESCFNIIFTSATCSSSTAVANRCPSTSIFSTSFAAKNASTCSAVSAISCLRILSSKFSSTCVISVMSIKPKVAAPPFIEWAARKIALSSSSSGLSMSMPRSKRSASANSSSASSKKTS